MRDRTHPLLIDWATQHGATEIVAAQWAFTTPTAMVTLPGGSQRVVQLLDRDQAARRAVGAMVLRTAGIAAPRILGQTATPQGLVVQMEHIEGSVAAAFLGGDNAALMASGMGAVLTVLAAAPTRSAPFSVWNDRGRLLGAADRWGDSIPSVVASLASSAIQVVSGMRWTAPVLAHGDYVPANALMRDGAVVALVDTADVALRHRLVDVAWWCLVVRHHHPADTPAVEPAFLRAADAAEDAAVLPAVAILRTAELLAEGSRPRGPLLALFETGARWMGSAATG